MLNPEKFSAMMYHMGRCHMRTISADIIEAWYIELKDYPDNAVFEALRALGRNGSAYPCLGAVIDLIEPPTSKSDAVRYIRQMLDLSIDDYRKLPPEIRDIVHDFGGLASIRQIEPKFLPSAPITEQIERQMKRSGLKAIQGLKSIT